jgi:hypothetical protein
VSFKASLAAAPKETIAPVNLLVISASISNCGVIGIDKPLAPSPLLISLVSPPIAFLALSIKELLPTFKELTAWSFALSNL